MPSPRRLRRLKKLERITIPKKIRAIGAGTFAGCTALEEVVSDGGCWVGERAFSGCSALKSFNFGGLDGGWVREYAFENCSALKTVENTNMLRIIYEGAFSGCSALERIELTGMTEQIGKDAFKGCDKLTVVTSSGSAAADYAQANGIKTEFPAPTAEPSAAPTETP